MPIESYFRSAVSGEYIDIGTVMPGDKNVISGFVECFPIIGCDSDNRGGVVLFLDRNFLKAATTPEVPVNMPKDMELGTYEIGENETYTKILTHNVWGPGELVLIHSS